MTSSDALLLDSCGGGVSGGVTSTIGQQQRETYAQKETSTMHQHGSTKDEGVNKEAEATASNNDTGATAKSSLYPITDLDTISKRLQQAKALEEECKIFTAANLLQNIDPKHFETVHHDIIKEAKLFQCLLDDCAELPDATINNNHDGATAAASSSDSSDGEWIKQGEAHNNHNFSIYYKINPTTNHIKCRLETPIQPKLLLSILAVLNETELYKTWIPQYKIPRLQVVKSDKLCQLGRVSQIILVETEVPWPITKRELILKAVACDDIDHDDYDDDDIDENCDDGCNSSNSNISKKKKSRILVRLQSLDCENNGEDGIEILPTSNTIGSGVRIKVDGGFVFEKCPSDHPMSKCSRKDKKKNNNKNNKYYHEENNNKMSSVDEKNEGGREENSNNYDENDDNLILLTFTFSVDPKLSILPQSFLNFFLRTAIHQIWGMFLDVATEVCDGKRPEHSAAITRKRVELYDWVEERTRCMLRCGSMMETK